MSKQLKTLLDSSQELNPLLNKVRFLLVLQRLFISVAPPHLSQTCQVLGLQQGILTISVANTTIAAKLRQIAPELIPLLKSRACEISGIRVKVQVSFERQPTKREPRTLSKVAQKVLNDFSEGMDDSLLRETLARIAKNKELK